MKTIALYVVGALIVGGGAFAAGRFSVKSTYTEVPLLGASEVAVRSDVEADLLMLRSENAALRSELEAVRTAATEEVTGLPGSSESAASIADLAEAQPAAEGNAEAQARQQRRRERRQPTPEAMAMMRERMAETHQNRVSFLDSVDISLLTAEQQAVHAAYTDALARRAEAMETMMLRAEAGEEPTDEERRALWENSRELRRLQEAERGALFEAVGVSMGLSQEDAVSLSETIREINDSTSDSFRRMPGPPPPSADGQTPPPPGA